MRSEQVGFVRAPIASVEAALLSGRGWTLPDLPVETHGFLVRVGEHSFQSTPRPGEPKAHDPIRLDLRSVGGGTEVTLTAEIRFPLRMRLWMWLFGLSGLDLGAGTLDVFLPGLEAEALAIERAAGG